MDKLNPAAAKKPPEVVAKPAGYARRVVVKLGYLSGTDAEVVAGIQAGDRVVTMGKNALREGAALQIVGGAAR
jgi:membrane fusion protein (multidrug efflux system)